MRRSAARGGGGLVLSVGEGAGDGVRAGGYGED